MRGVLDASMALAWLFTRANPAEAALAEQALDSLSQDSWTVPAIWHTELANGLVRGERAGLIPASQSAFFLEKLSQASIDTDDESGQGRLSTVLALARAYRLTAYDASYLDLALRAGGTLATFDQQLAAAARKAGGLVFGDTP